MHIKIILVTPLKNEVLPNIYMDYNSVILVTRKRAGHAELNRVGEFPENSRQGK